MKNQLITIFKKHTEVSIFIIALLYGGWKIFLYDSLSISAGHDEIGTIAGAAFFAGYDWKSYISTFGYYNFGYTIFMAPVFILFDNITLISRTMLFINIVLVSFCVTMLYIILKKYFGLNKIVCIFLAILCNYSYISAYCAWKIQNEVSFRAWFILCIFLILLTNEKKQNCHKYIWHSFFLGIIMGYGYSIHARFLVAVFAFLFAELIYILFYRKTTVSLVFLPSFALSFYLTKKLVIYYKASIWGTAAIAKLENSTEAGISWGTVLVEKLFSEGNWEWLLKRAISLTYSFTFTSNGIFIFSLSGCILFIFYILRTQCKNNENDKNIFLLLLISSCATLGMILLTILIGYSKDAIDVKWNWYIRYAAPFCPAFLCCGMGSLLKVNAIKKPGCCLSLAIIYIITCFGLYLQIKHPEEYLSGPVKRFSFYPSEYFSNGYFIRTACILIVLSMTVAILLAKKRELIFLCIMILLIFSMDFWPVPVKRNDTAYYRANATKMIYDQYHFNADDNIHIYFSGTDPYCQAVRFTLYDCNMDYIEDFSFLSPDEKYILLTDTEELGIFINAKYVYKLDENEWLLTNLDSKKL